MVEINNIPFTNNENFESVITDITDIARKVKKLDHFNYIYTIFRCCS